jgi:hypothetical protein
MVFFIYVKVVRSTNDPVANLCDLILRIKKPPIEKVLKIYILPNLYENSLSQRGTRASNSHGLDTELPVSIRQSRTRDARGVF